MKIWQIFVFLLLGNIYLIQAQQSGFRIDPSEADRIQHLVVSENCMAYLANKAVIVWNLEAGKSEVLHDFKNDYFDIDDMVIDPEGKTIALACDDDSIRLIRFNPKTLNHKDPQAFNIEVDNPLGLFYLPNGLLASGGGYQEEAIIWSRVDGRPRDTIRGMEDDIMQIAYSETEKKKFLLFLDESGNIACQRYNKKEKVSIFENDEGYDIAVMAAHPSKALVAFSTYDEGVFMYGYGNGNGVKISTNEAWELGDTLYQNADQFINSIAYSPDGEYLAVGGWLSEIFLLGPKFLKKEGVLIGGSNSVQSLIFTPDARFVISTDVDQRIQIYDVGEGKLVLTILSYQSGKAWASMTPSGEFDTDRPDQAGLAQIKEIVGGVEKGVPSRHPRYEGLLVKRIFGRD